MQQSFIISAMFMVNIPCETDAQFFVLVNTVVEMFEVEDLPLQLQREMQDGYKVGYVCSHYCLF